MKYFVFSIKFIIILAFFGILNTRYQIPNTVYAEGTSLQIKPAVLQIKATSPADVHAPFRIQNLGNETISLKIILKHFRDAGDESGKIVYSSSELTNEAENDAFLKNVQVVADGSVAESITLGPQQEKELELLVNLDGASGQDHYFSVIFLTSDINKPKLSETEAKETSYSSIQTGIALPVLMSTAPNTKSVGFIDTFEAPLALQNGPVGFTVRVKNTGEHFIQARGAILVKNMFGQTVGKIDISPANILAGSTRALSNDDNNKMVWSEKFLFGFYTATLTLALSSDQVLYTRYVHFVAFPFSLIVGILLVSIIAFILLRRIKRKVSEE